MLKEVNVYTGFQVIVHNKDYACGQYYPEDNWTISIFAEKIEEIIPKFIEEYFRTEIDIISGTIYKVEIMEYEGNTFIIPETEKKSKLDFYQDFYIPLMESKEFKEAKEKYTEEKEKIKEEAKIKAIKESEKHEREQYERLKKKFDENQSS